MSKDKHSCGFVPDVGIVGVHNTEVLWTRDGRRTPPPKAIVIEYRLHCLGCVACGVSTKAEFPAGLSPSVFGATVHALAALLMGRFRQSKRLVAELLDVLYGLTLSPGTVCATEQRVSAALEAPVDAARASLRSQEAVGMDETGWRLTGPRMGTQEEQSPRPCPSVRPPDSALGSLPSVALPSGQSPRV